MPSLDSIVTQINTDLIASQFKGKKFQKGSFNGIVELIKSTLEGETKPGIVADNGNVTKTIFTDSESFIAYHRVLDLEYADADDDFGDLDLLKETASMKLVMCATTRDVVEVTKEEMVAGIGFGMPREFTKAFRDALTIRSIIINPGSFELDKSVVWGAEFGIEQALYKTNTILVSYEYQIVTEMKRDCFVLCS